VPLFDRPALRRWSLIALLALAAAGAVAVVAVRHWRGRPERTRIVVAVFANRTGDPELEQFGSMAADWVTRGLARTPTVEVVDLGALYVEGRTASGQPTDPLELARRKGAGSVVAGSYYVSEDPLRTITVYGRPRNVAFTSDGRTALVATEEAVVFIR
jgi:TolB-like protein